MYSKTGFKLAIVALFLFSLYGVFGMPDLSLVEDYSVENFTLHRNKRDVWTGVGGAVNTIDKITDQWSANIAACTESGCSCGYNNKCYCWARCLGALGTDARGKEWCWTTKGRSQDYNYVECAGPSDCNGCWKCAGACTLWIVEVISNT